MTNSLPSQLISTLHLKYAPVALLFTDDKPENALEFAKGRFGCVMATFGVVAERGKVAVFDRETFGCPGGGVGLGFGAAYKGFFGGEEGFCGFLSSGNEHSETGHALCEKAESFIKGEMLQHFRHGEGYRKSPSVVTGFIKSLPIVEIPTKYLVFKQLGALTETEIPEVVSFLVNPLQLSALVILANYDREDNESVIFPHAASCQTIGIYPFREAKSAHPRAVVGHTDLSARRTLRRLGEDLLTFSVPYRRFIEMEANVAGSFLERDTWLSLNEHKG